MKEEIKYNFAEKMVIYAIKSNKALSDFSMEEFKNCSDIIEEDIYEAISLKTCVEKRLTKGAPGKAAMLEVIKVCEAYLTEE